MTPDRSLPAATAVIAKGLLPDALHSVELMLSGHIRTFREHQSATKGRAAPDRGCAMAATIWTSPPTNLRGAQFLGHYRRHRR